MGFTAWAPRSAAWCSGGMFLGELRAESGRLANTAWVWPVFSRLLDWNHLERSLNDKRID